MMYVQLLSLLEFPKSESINSDKGIFADPKLRFITKQIANTIISIRKVSLYVLLGFNLLQWFKKRCRIIF